jgi:signal peptidase II
MRMFVLCLSFSIVFVDQVAKYLIKHGLSGGHATIIPGLFNLHFVRNTGAAWGILGGLNAWLVGLSFIMLVVIIVCRSSLFNDTVMHRIVMGLMIGGIVGNLIDRAKLAYVVDFLDFYWRSHHFPAFNVADAAICTGVGLYILGQISFKRKSSGDMEVPEPCAHERS